MCRCIRLRCVCNSQLYLTIVCVISFMRNANHCWLKVKMVDRYRLMLLYCLKISIDFAENDFVLSV